LRRPPTGPRCPGRALLLLGLVLLIPAPCSAAGSGPEWPYTPLARPPVPAVRQKDWARNPLDAFVLAKLEEAGLQPNPPADKLTLLRRVTYDLTGLAPTPAECAAFLADRS